MVPITVGTEEEEDQMARSSAYREQLTEGGKEAKRSLMKRDPSGTSRQTHKERLL